MMEPPTSRYSVIEKGRRLFVYDRGEPVDTIVHVARPASVQGKKQEPARREGPVRPNAMQPASRPGTARREVGRSAKTLGASGGNTDGASAGRLIGSIAVVSVLVLLFWPVLVPVLIFAAVGLSAFRGDGEPIYKRLFGAWWRWVNRT